MHRLSTLTAPASTSLAATSRQTAPVRKPLQVTAVTSPPTTRLETLKQTGAAALVAATLALASPALAELNKYEYNAGGEFGVGTAQQYGEADIKKRDFSGQDLTRSNFTSADCRECNFKGANLRAAYFIKTVVYKANFEDADLSDTLMDRAVLNEANLTNAILERVVLTRSDLGGAIIQGADFSNALIDRDQQMALCRYADGVNPVTGIDTRQSLGCGSKRRFKAQSPSSVEGPQVSPEEAEQYKRSLPGYQQ